MRLSRATVACLAALLVHIPAPAKAARSYDNCTGFIDSVPATISTQGSWCLRKDLATSMTTGSAIIVNANNVTIDCNDFKIGGLGGGAGTVAWGISSINRLNTTVRNCVIRGFSEGVRFRGVFGGGHVIEDNRFDANTYQAIVVEGAGSIVRRNQILDTGGSSGHTYTAKAVVVSFGVDVIDNQIDGVAPAGDPNDGVPVGIETDLNYGASISGNRIRGLVPKGSGAAFGIRVLEGLAPVPTAIRDNVVIDMTGINGTGLHCGSAAGLAKDNIVSGFSTLIANCTGADNLTGP